MTPLRIRTRRPGRRIGGRAFTLLAWCRAQDLDVPLAAAFFLAARLFGWPQRKVGQEFGRSRATVGRWLPRGKADLISAIEEGRVRGDQLRELAERLADHGLGG